MNIDEIEQRLSAIDPEFYSNDPDVYSEYKFFGYHVLENNHELFWMFFNIAKDLSVYRSEIDDYEMSSVVEEISDECDWHNRIIEYPLDKEYDLYDGFKFNKDSSIFSDLATQISFIMAMFKYGNIKESVEYLLCGLKKDSIKVVVLTVNSETMSYKELK